MPNLYEPLRDELSKKSLWTGLMSVFAYSQFLQEDEFELPEQLQTPRLHAASEPWEAGLFPWTLELLARELILNGVSRGGEKPTDGRSVFELLSMIEKVESAAWGRHEGAPDDVMLELARIAYRQFHWQKGITNEDLARYYLMFSEPELASSIQAEFGLSVIELFQLILLLKNEMTQQPMLQTAFTRVVDPSVLPALDALAQRLGKPIEEMRKATADVQKYDINWAYTFNPLREFPLIHAGNERSMMCPVPYLLTRRLTEGVYYDLVRRDDNSAGRFGHAFEAYVGRAATKEIGDHAAVIGEQVYGQPEKRSVDWIVEDASATLFVECKFTRPDLKTQTIISDIATLSTGLKRLGDAIAQVYATLSDALDGEYSHWSSDGRPAYPLVVTLTEWYGFGTQFSSTLQAHVDAGFAKRGLDPTLLDRHPFSFCSAAEYEGLLSVLRTKPIDEVMSGKVEGETREWMFGPYLNGKFPAQLVRDAALFGPELMAAIYGPSRFTRVGAAA